MITFCGDLPSRSLYIHISVRGFDTPPYIERGELIFSIRNDAIFDSVHRTASNTFKTHINNRCVVSRDNLYLFDPLFCFSLTAFKQTQKIPQQQQGLVVDVFHMIIDHHRAY